jgi:hypothetical protein
MPKNVYEQAPEQLSVVGATHGEHWQSRLK